MEQIGLIRRSFLLFRSVLRSWNFSIFSLETQNLAPHPPSDYLNNAMQRAINQGKLTHRRSLTENPYFCQYNLSAVQQAMQGQMPGYKRSYGEDPFYSGATNGGHSPLSSGCKSWIIDYDSLSKKSGLYGYSGSSSSMPSGKIQTTGVTRGVKVESNSSWSPGKIFKYY